MNKNFFSDPSLWLLLFSNLMTIGLAVKGNWGLTTIMWIYWWQSIIIGFFNFIRILQLKEFSTAGFRIGNVPAQATTKTKIFTAFFFLVHYGGFHFGYLIFLAADFFSYFSPRSSHPPTTGWNYILLTALLFFLNHLFSYFYNRPQDNKKQNIGNLMFYPYARIIPMHLTIIFGGWIVVWQATGLAASTGESMIYGQIGVLIFFLLLKTLADCLMHIIEHRVLSKEGG